MYQIHFNFDFKDILAHFDTLCTLKSDLKQDVYSPLIVLRYSTFIVKYY